MAVFQMWRDSDGSHHPIEILLIVSTYLYEPMFVVCMGAVSVLNHPIRKRQDGTVPLRNGDIPVPRGDLIR